MSDRTIKINFGDCDLSGLPGSERVGRVIVMAVREAIEHIVSCGWDRDRHIDIETSDDGLPAVTLCSKRVFEICIERSAEDGLVSYSGRWLAEIDSPQESADRGWLGRFVSRLRNA